MKYVTYNFLVKHHACDDALKSFHARFGVKRVPIPELVNWLHQDQQPRRWEGWCLSRPHVAFVKAMLAAGADVHACDDLALRSTAQTGPLAIVKLLLAAGADVHARQDEALCAAVFCGGLDIVKALLAAGANARARNGEALQIALDFGYIQTAALLHKAMAA